MRDILGGLKLKRVMFWEKMQEAVEVSSSAIYVYQATQEIGL
jgi:hypothetical protein